MLRPFHPRPGEAGPDLKTFRSRQAEHRLREVGFQFIEHWLTKTRVDTAYDAFDHAADRIAFSAHGLNQRRHQLRGSFIRTTNGVALDSFNSDGSSIDACHDFVNLNHVRDNFEAPLRKFAQEFFRNCAGRDAPNGFSRGGTATTLPVSDAVLRLVSEVGV